MRFDVITYFRIVIITALIFFQMKWMISVGGYELTGASFDLSHNRFFYLKFLNKFLFFNLLFYSLFLGNFNLFSESSFDVILILDLVNGLFCYAHFD